MIGNVPSRHGQNSRGTVSGPEFVLLIVQGAPLVFVVHQERGDTVDGAETGDSAKMAGGAAGLASQRAGYGGQENGIALGDLEEGRTGKAQEARLADRFDGMKIFCVRAYAQQIPTVQEGHHMSPPIRKDRHAAQASAQDRITSLGMVAFDVQGLIVGQRTDRRDSCQLDDRVAQAFRAIRHRMSKACVQAPCKQQVLFKSGCLLVDRLCPSRTGAHGLSLLLTVILAEIAGKQVDHARSIGPGSH